MAERGHNKNPIKPRVKVQLTCGCNIMLRNNPFRPGAKFTCASGLSHGYQLNWVSWTDQATGRSGTNRLYA